MGLEAATYISGLVTTNPVNATDYVSQGDDHLRLLKSVLQSTFPDADHAMYLDAAQADVASATETAIGGATSNFVRITGTTTITSFGTVRAGTWRFIRFAGALTLTHNGTSLILPGGANITTAANDCALAVSLGSGNWIVLFYTTAATASDPANPSSDDGDSLGTSSLRWSDLFLADGAVVNWDDGDVTLTHSSGLLTLAGILVMGGSLRMADQALERPYLKDIAETVYAHGSVSGAVELNFENGNVQTMTVTGATSITFADAPATGRHGSMLLIVTNAGGNITWPSAVKWPGNVEPTLTTSGRDRLVFMTEDAGTTIDANLVGLDYS